MGRMKWRQGRSLDVQAVHISPRPLTENQVRREEAKRDVENREQTSNRIINWLFGREQ